jgi:hypothetical protein
MSIVVRQQVVVKTKGSRIVAADPDSFIRADLGIQPPSSQKDYRAYRV